MAPKKTRINENKHFQRVGPITSRETLVRHNAFYNIRSALNIKIKQCIKRRDNATREMKQYVAALNALIKEKQRNE